MDEAHNFLADADTVQAQKVVQKFTEAAKQGRKERLGLFLITQDPQDVAESVFKQINTKVVLNLGDEDAISSVNIPSNLAGKVPYMEKGQMVVYSPDNSEPVELIGLSKCVTRRGIERRIRTGIGLRSRRSRRRPFTPSERSAHMAKRILVAVDGSTEARDALAFAASEWPDAELTALHVINPADSATGADGGFPGAADQWYDSAKQRGERILTEATAAVDRDIETRLEVGRPTATILGVAGGEKRRRRRRRPASRSTTSCSESGSDGPDSPESYSEASPRAWSVAPRCPSPSFGEAARVDHSSADSASVTSPTIVHPLVGARPPE